MMWYLVSMSWEMGDDADVEEVEVWVEAPIGRDAAIIALASIDDTGYGELHMVHVGVGCQKPDKTSGTHTIGLRKLDEPESPENSLP